MKPIRFACILLTLSSVVAAPPAASTVIRTLVYHEITSFTSATVVNSTPVLSDSGNRAAFAQAPGPEPTRTTHVFVINADGTGQHEVDTYQQLCFCGAELDISADGSRVLSTDGIQIRMVNADGTNPMRSFGLTVVLFESASPPTARKFFSQMIATFPSGAKI